MSVSKTEVIGSSPVASANNMVYIAQIGRAGVCEASCHRFESDCTPNLFKI